MRLVRLLGICLLPVALAGCLSVEGPTRWRNPLSFLQPPADPDTALVQYVVIERTAGSADINRRAWDRVDEQILPYEVRTVLEDAGLRVGIAAESAPGPLRRLIDDPRTSAGHRARTFAMDRPAPLVVSANLPRASFTIPTAEDRQSSVTRERVLLGFDLTVRDAADNKVVVSLVPRARYHDPGELLTADAGDRGQVTELFPTAGFEVTLAASEYLVVGTDDYWEGRFGHAAFTDDLDERRVQRLLVLRAGRAKADRAAPAFLASPEDRAEALPLVSQVHAARGSMP